MSKNNYLRKELEMAQIPPGKVGEALGYRQVLVDKAFDGPGRKNDAAKLRYDLLSPWATEQLVKVLTHGAQKYSARNWERGIAWTRVIAAIKRHLAAIEMGEEIDPESGLPHSAHAACEIHFLQHFEQWRREFNDLPKPEGLKK